MTTVIYHSGDYDGIFCREIAMKFLDAQMLPGETVDYIGWNFGDPAIDLASIDQLYVMDLPMDRPFGSRSPRAGWAVGDPDVVWIDHHKSAIETHDPKIPGYRIDGVAACRLAWQWFVHHMPQSGSLPPLPHKDAFTKRMVSEPLAVRLAGEYDVWDHRGDGDLELQFGLRAETSLSWDHLLSTEPWGTGYTEHLITVGKAVMVYAQTVDAGNMKASFSVKWEGLTFLCLNGRGNSNTFASKDTPETGHDALMMFYFNGKQWIISLYHAKHRTDLDLSVIAVKHGGGGHKGACGFTCDKLPFMA